MYTRTQKYIKYICTPKGIYKMYIYIIHIYYTYTYKIHSF